MKRKTKQTLKTLALSVLGIGALVGVASGINALAEKQDTELKTIIPIFEVGGLKDADGKYEETKGSIYTKDAFECQGLEIALDFDNTIDYQVFYYESDGDFVSASGVISGNEKLVVPYNATHARIEVTPNWDEMGEDYADEEKQVIKWYDVLKYSSQLEIKVDKEQIIYEQSENLWVKNSSMTVDNFYSINKGDSASNYSTTNAAQFNSSALIDVTEYDKLVVVVDYDKVSGVNFHTWTATETLIEYKPLSLTTDDVEVFINGNVATYIFDLEKATNYISFSNKVISSVGETKATVEVYGLK